MPRVRVLISGRRTRGTGAGARRGRPGLFERWFAQPALSVVVGAGLYGHVDPWPREQAPARAPIPAPRRSGP